MMTSMAISKKYFDYFRNFRKLNPSKFSHCTIIGISVEQINSGGMLIHFIEI